MINSYISVEQVSREQQRIEVKEESSLVTEMYSGGFFDGLIGLEPSQPGDDSYWSGYQVGNREYWAKKRGVKIPTKF